MFELRAAARLNRLCRSDESRMVLDRLYRQMTEGFETIDLSEARSLLAQNAHTQLA